MATRIEVGDSLELRLAARGGRPVGFDYLRLILALSVLLLHESDIVYGPMGANALWHSPFSPVYRLVVPMFFALSGFLVAGSFERCRTMFKFFGLRALRIYPALGIETIISAMIVGPIFTNHTVTSYFSDPLFVHYLRNILGDPQYFLPGLFATNPDSTVNGQLWTIPYELFCYLSIGAVALFGGRKRRFIAPLGAIAATIAYLAMRYVHNGDLPDVHHALAAPLLVPCFLAAVTIYIYREDIPARPAYLIAALVLAVILLGIPGYTQFLAPWPIAYATVCLGTLDLPKNWFSHGADYSYGIYLYGWPVQQTVVYLFPAQNSIAFNTVTSILVATVIAAISWHYVEKPILAWRTKLSDIEQWLLDWRERRTLAKAAG